MARFTFGGSIRDLVTAPDASLGGALKINAGARFTFFTAQVGGSVSTDYLIDADGDGVYETAVTSVPVRATGYLEDFQGPDGVTVLWYDPNPSDADVRRVRMIAHDAAAAGVSNASTTAAGVVRLPTATERDAGTSTALAMTPADVAARINAHVNATDPHPTLTAAVSDLSASLANKADLTVGTGLVPITQLPTASTASDATIPLRRTGGTVAVGSATADDEAVPLLQVNQLVQSAGQASDVRYTELATQPTVASATAFSTLATVAVTDAVSAQKWQCDWLIKYRATTAAGIQVRHKLPTSAVTNKLANPSFETDAANWTVANPSTSVARSTTVGGFSGTAALAVTTVSTTSQNQLVWSEFVPCTPGSAWSAGGYTRFGSGTVRTNRVDIIFSDATGSHTIAGAATLGSAVTPTTTFQRSTLQNVIAPSWATQVCVRLAVTGAGTTGDVNYFDAVQLEQAATLPAFGSTGGSGSSALAHDGYWDGLKIAATDLEGYGRRTSIRYPTDTNLTSAHGGVGITADATLVGSFVTTVGGTGLSGQRIELEFAQRVTDAANPTQITSATAVFARLA